MTDQRKRARDAVAQAEPLCVFASMGPTEVCDEPAIYMESPTDGDPAIIAVIKRIHREDLLHEALNHANFYRRDMLDTPPAPVPAPAAEVVARLRRALDRSPDATRCNLNRETVEAVLEFVAAPAPTTDKALVLETVRKLHNDPPLMNSDQKAAWDEAFRIVLMAFDKMLPAPPSCRPHARPERGRGGCLTSSVSPNPERNRAS